MDGDLGIHTESCSATDMQRLDSGSEKDTILEGEVTFEIIPPQHSQLQDDDATKPLQGDSTGAQVQPDGGWGWVVCFASFLVSGLTNATMITFGVLYVAMVEEFAKGDPDQAFKTSWVGSVMTGLVFLMSAVAGVASDRFGLRKVAFTGGFLAFIGMLSSAFVQDLMLLYLTYGVCIGVGFGLSFVLSIAILGHYFKKRLGLANGLVTFGNATFAMVYSLMIPTLINTVGLQYTLLCLSGFSFLIMPCALTWKPRIERCSTRLESARTQAASEGRTGGRDGSGVCMCTCKFLDVTIWRNRGYVAWAVAMSVTYLGLPVPFIHIVKHSQDIFPASNGNLLPLFTSVAMGVSRLGFGLLADVRCLNPVHIQQAALLTLGITTICIPTAHSFPGLVVLALALGVSNGLFFLLMGPIVTGLVGEGRAAQALGFCLAMISLPNTVGSPLAGLLYDHLGSYTVAFHAAGVAPIAGALIMLLIPRQGTKKYGCCCPRSKQSQVFEDDQTGNADPII
ncbi:hypothetical protein BaRGS_00038277 [Batillaria attramentaria]|uniref:Uncharacterized protein n=1 Tax=Batillaria attramentaria TaxID=370345 RepID=A0ABD0J7R4_9CAEN